MKNVLFIGLLMALSCGQGEDKGNNIANDDVVKKVAAKDTVKDFLPTRSSGDAKTTPDELMKFAETQIGVPYVYASCDPKVGFDCSGFVTYVFNHFHIPVPRSSYGFTHLGTTVPYNKAKRGDVILFTGTDSLSTDVGHIGLITANNNGNLSFIHATSGKTMAVTVSTVDARYKKRFVRICRLLDENG